MNDDQRSSVFDRFRREILGCLVAHCVLWLPVVLLVHPGDEIRPMISVAGSMLMSLAALLRGFGLGVRQLFHSGNRLAGIRFLAWGAIPVATWIATEVFLHMALGIRYGR